MIQVKCPGCGVEFDVKCRARIGEGTQIKRGWNENRREIFMVLCDGGLPMTVDEVLRGLQKARVKRYQRSDKDKPTGSWNYHNVQADLSLMVGNNMIKMSTGTETFDDHGVTVRPAPKYWV